MSNLTASRKAGKKATGAAGAAGQEAHGWPLLIVLAPRTRKVAKKESNNFNESIYVYLIEKIDQLRKVKKFKFEQEFFALCGWAWTSEDSVLEFRTDLDRNAVPAIEHVLQTEADEPDSGITLAVPTEKHGALWLRLFSGDNKEAVVLRAEEHIKKIHELLANPEYRELAKQVIAEIEGTGKGQGSEVAGDVPSLNLSGPAIERLKLSGLEALRQGEDKCEALHQAAVERFKQLLHDLEGFEGASREERHDVARRVTRQAHRLGLVLMTQNESGELVPVTIRCRRRSFEVRRSGGLPIGSYDVFPSLKVDVRDDLPNALRD